MCRQLATSEKQAKRLKQAADRSAAELDAFRELLNCLDQPVITLRDGRIAFANAAFVSFTGYDKVVLFRMDLDELFIEQAITDLSPYFAADTSPTEVSGTPAELGIKHADGPHLPLIISSIHRHEVDKSAFVSIIAQDPSGPRDSVGSDLFDKRQRQTQKLETIGSLAGGIAHDMNNILSTIMSITSVLRQEAERGTSIVEDFDDILAATRRGADLTRNLLGFAKEGKQRKENISLNYVSQKVKDLLTRTIAKNIKWELQLDPNLPPTSGDFGQLSHALMNICINAADAMGGGGKLTISTRSIALRAQDHHSLPELGEGKYVLLQVNDTGKGMDSTTLHRAFEPFFTTKGRDTGTGLGLSMVYSTVSNHDGVITIDSQIGRGTTVSIYLPQAESHGFDRRTLTNIPPLLQQPTSGKVLVVDDEALILRSAKRVLESLGYEVLLAESGREALRLFEAHRNEIMLVILDLIMPEMDGEETFHALQAEDPSVPVLLATGFARDEKADALLRTGAAGFVQKPFDVQRLSRGIRVAQRS